MDTQKAIELLPWYLNGTLDSDEQSEVERHLASSEECRQALADTRAAAALFNAHVPTEALVAHAFGDKTEGINQETIEEHLKLSRQEAELHELVMQSRGALDWSQRSEQQRSEPGLGDIVTPVKVARNAANDNGAAQRWRAAAIAASLACVMALTGWLTRGAPSGTRSGDLGGDLQARAGSQVIDLHSASVYRGEETEVPSVVVGETEVLMSFDLPRNADGTPAYAPHGAKRVKIVDAAGTVVYEIGGRAPSDSFYNVTLPANAHLDGLYQVQLFEADASNAEPLAVYPFRALPAGTR